MKTIISIILFSLFFLSCKKDGRGCWQGWDSFSATEGQGYLFCDKTKAEVETQYPALWFYRQGEATYCWKLVNGSNTVYVFKMPESIKERYAGSIGTFTKLDCGSFCQCEWLERHKGKLTGQYGLNKSIKEVFFSTDTCSKLSIGKIVIMSETTDSLITRELIKKQP